MRDITNEITKLVNEIDKKQAIKKQKQILLNLNESEELKQDINNLTENIKSLFDDIINLGLKN